MDVKFLTNQGRHGTSKEGYSSPDTYVSCVLIDPVGPRSTLSDPKVHNWGSQG